MLQHQKVPFQGQIEGGWGWGGGGGGGAPSMHFTSASSKSDVSKNDTRSDFWPLLRLPWFDKDGGTSVFSTSNKVSALPSLTCSER